MIHNWFRRYAFSTPKFPKRRGGIPPEKVRLGVEVLEDRSLPSSVPLDPSFGTGGVVVDSFSQDYDQAERVAVQRDGKIVVAGTAQNSFFAVPVSVFVARYNPDGSLDTGFGQGGVVTFNQNRSDNVLALVLQRDGKILVSGSVTGPAQVESSIFVARLNADGSPDSTFNSSLAAGLGTDLTAGEADGLALQSDGKIIVAATSTLLGMREIIVARLNTDGQLDTTFGQGGKVETQPDGFAGGVVVQSDDKIVVAGNVPAGTDRDYVVLRLLADGRPDSTFGTGGVVTTDFAGGFDTPTGLLLQRDGKLIVTGSSRTASNITETALLRYTTTGGLDPTFGNGGKVANTAVLGARGALQVDGKLVIAGTATRADRSEFNQVLGLARFNPDGSLDGTYGNGGIVITVMPATLFHQQSAAMDVAVQGDGNIMAVGAVTGQATTSPGTMVISAHSVVARYLAVDTRPPSQRFVASVYEDLLGRPAEAAGLASWAGLIDRGISRFDVVRAIENSPEYRVAEVRQAYEMILQRLPDGSGLNTWTLFLAQGGTLVQLEALLLGSAEYYARFGQNNPTTFLQQLYAVALNRPIDPTGQAVWSQALAAGASPVAVALAVLLSPEAAALRVRLLYLHLLERNPDPTGLAMFTQALQAGVPDDVVIALIASSQEYYNRAQ
jgi:uncharacterized delta-60 repeat protein